MLILNPTQTRSQGRAPRLSDTRKVYFDLLQESVPASKSDDGQAYLAARLQEAGQLASDLPADWRDLPQWVQANTQQVGRQYRAYLESRKAGGKRRYFSSKAHALYFLKAVAPTKLVDGAWLYGLTSHWGDARFTELIRIYLEELGEGIPDKNHVVIFKKLLAAHGCDQWQDLDDAYFVQGAIQLALGHHAGRFLPEVIGFNLGYEQLPLHLLITAYELNELGIDPYYFTLHVTVDNAASGHARRALQGLYDALPHATDKAEFYRRVNDGYKLNMLGASTMSVIEEFDLRKELLAIFSAKAGVGSCLHSDYCRVAGKSVNEWLSDPAQLPVFLDKLEQAGWLKRHEDPENSRFWKLIHGEHAEMFGVFNTYEKQVIHDSIIGDAASADTQRPLSYRSRQRLLTSIGQPPRAHTEAARGVLRNHYSGRDGMEEGIDDFNIELRTLEDQLAESSSRAEMMETLGRLISPASHHSAAGLMATRIYTQLFNNF
ncbi:MAG: iron-containing redox enzyme family protein [Burkholderiaceae bacterium]